MSRPDSTRSARPAASSAASALQAFDSKQLFVAHDPKSRKLLEQVEKVAPTTATLLIRGESGTGKDLLAELIHFLSSSANRGAGEPFVKIDCASLPHELVESELFGYEKGAFTGATEMKRGRLELAGAGTLVLDEIAALSMPAQAKLLRVIEERKFDRLGGSKPITVEARLIALTNIDLEHAVARKTFREDLYYRLNVVPLTVTPLRERPADIAPLAEHLVAQLAEVHRKPKPALSAAAARALEQYAFPGNVRELRNILERAVVYGSGGELQAEDLPAHVAGGRAGGKQTLEQRERAYIAEVLEFTRGKKSQAAAILGISRKTLLEKRKRYGLD
ncbi:MAG: sigma-54-dependent Fis family transcriptional regulator [Candidatus Koribacter versatilis]|uniref:Sigma-54-dependent Fis family transcriptional regulator n=1 Tax=Candidatus Korobacter versatilis TaxID=658062 RepID=A0A932ENV6_9BACT|nr:sigma-54-dependent Fis family transcriptional regulator [Candidatus Koribacter versatilis]